MTDVEKQNAILAAFQGRSDHGILSEDFKYGITQEEKEEIAAKTIQRCTRKWFERMRK